MIYPIAAGLTIGFGSDLLEYRLDKLPSKRTVVIIDRCLTHSHGLKIVADHYSPRLLASTGHKRWTETSSILTTGHTGTDVKKSLLL